MPRLPTYTAESNQYGVPSGRRATAADFFDPTARQVAGAGAEQAQGAVARAARQIGKSPLGEQLELFGATARRVAEQHTQMLEKRDVADQQVAATQARARAYERLQKLKLEGDPDVDVKMEEFLEQEAENLREMASTRAGMIAAERGIGTLTVDVGYSARSAKAEVLGEKAQNDANEVLQSWESVIDTEPEQLPRAIDEISIWAQSQPIPEQAQRALEQEMHRDIALAAGRRWIRYDGELGKRMAESDKFDPWITADDKEALIKSAERAIESERADERRLNEQTRRQAANSRAFTEIDLLNRIASGEEDPMLVLAEARELGMTAGADGAPRLLPQQIRNVAAATDKEISGVETELPKGLHDQLMVDFIRGTFTSEQYAENVHLMSKAESRMFASALNQRDPELDERRRAAVTQVAYNALGVTSPNDIIAMGGGPSWQQAHDAFRAKEEQLKADGKDPMVELYGDPVALAEFQETQRQRFEDQQLAINAAMGEIVTAPIGALVPIGETYWRKVRPLSQDDYAAEDAFEDTGIPVEQFPTAADAERALREAEERRAQSSGSTTDPIQPVYPEGQGPGELPGFGGQPSYAPGTREDASTEDLPGVGAIRDFVEGRKEALREAGEEAQRREKERRKRLSGDDE